MSREDYRKARKEGLLHVKRAQSRGEDPYPAVLDQVLEGRTTRGEIPLGTGEIPVSLIAGTRTAGRQSALDREFYPLLEEDSEFASKWISLMKIQVEEGFRDPVKVYEYRNRFYVQEGNKRVSIMKVLGMPEILAEVTRVLPAPENTPEDRCYREFLKFHKTTGIWEILFSRPGSYEKLLGHLGKGPEEAWSDEEIRDLKSVYYRFTQGYSRISGQQRPETMGDAFLRALTVYPYETMRSQNPSELGKGVKSLKQELDPGSLGSHPVHVMEPEKAPSSAATDVVSKVVSPVAKVLPSKKPLKAAFLYDWKSTESEWSYAHELGRRELQESSDPEVETVVYEGLRTPEKAEKALEDAVKGGAKVIFTTTPKLMKPALKAALDHPEVYILNCSLDFPYKSVRTYYARHYEFRFLMGLIAGAMCRGEDLAYEADYPISGTTAGINAFAAGVQMVCPGAKVRLYWNYMKEGGSAEMKEKICLVRNSMVTREYDHPYGLFLQKDGQRVELASGVVQWGRFYRKILHSIEDGTWKKTGKETEPVNYWWGFSADVLELQCTDAVPEGTRRLAEEFQRYLSWGVCHPFRGTFTDQNGAVHGSAEEEMSPQQIAEMDWLLENVEGTIPVKENLTDPAREMVDLQGVLEERL